MKLVDFQEIRINGNKKRISLHTMYSEENKLRNEIEESTSRLNQVRDQYNTFETLCSLKQEEIKDLDNKLDLIYDQMESCYNDYLKFWENKS